MIYDEESLALLMEAKSKFPIYEKDGKKYVEKKLAKTKGSTVVDDIVIGTKKYQYIAQSDMEYYKGHPIEFLGKKIGSTIGAVTGAAVGGAGGAVAGAAVGGAAGTILGGAAGHRGGGTVGGGLVKSTKKGFDDLEDIMLRRDREDQRTLNKLGKSFKKSTPKKENHDIGYDDDDEILSEKDKLINDDDLGSLIGGAIGGVLGPGGMVAGNAYGTAVAKAKKDPNYKKDKMKTIQKAYEDELEAESNFMNNMAVNIINAPRNILNKKATPKKEHYYRYKEYEDVIKEHFDIFGTDEETNALININEADQSAVLLSLTNKFYDYIITKVDDIDFGEIDITRGDITKLSNYKRMVQCLIDIINIIKEYKQETSLVDDVLTCIDNIESSRDLWVKSYNVHNPLGQTMYRTMTLACIEATAVLVVNTIDFIKSPSSDTFQASFDKIAYNKTKNGLLFENIRSFNSAYSKGQVAKAMNYVLEANKKNFVGGVGVGASIIALSIIVITIIPILRELIFFFFYIRVSIADFFSIHANMIEMNLLNIDARKDIDKDKKKKISQKQKAIAEKFKAFANKIQVKTREAEYDTYKEIKANEKKYTASEVLETMPDSASSGSGSLF